MNNRQGKENRLRQQLVLCAARIMTEEGIADFYTAKCKAAKRMGITHIKNMPRNDEIKQALREQQQTFMSHSQPIQLNKRRMMALKIMSILEPFNPRLVGPVLRGTAGEHSSIKLHIFSDTPEEAGFLLLDNNIPYNVIEKRYIQKKGVRNKRSEKIYPGYQFIAGDTEVELTVFPVNGIRQAPPDPVDGKPMERATIDEVMRLIKDN